MRRAFGRGYRFVAAMVRAPPDAHELTPLDLFRAAPHDARAITYFDMTLDYGEVDRLSDAPSGMAGSARNQETRLPALSYRYHPRPAFRPL